MNNVIKTLGVEDIQDIENIIGYTFKKKGLLVQAFTRSSFVNENKEFVDNEILEFLGDRSLDMAVTKKLLETYGEVNDKEYFIVNNNPCFWESKEAFFSSVKKQLVQKETLSRRIDELDLAKHLIMGNGDSLGQSIKEDLFEAIIGAITIDVSWKLDDVFPIALKLSNFDKELITVLNEETLSGVIDKFYNWYQKHFGVIPEFEYESYNYHDETSNQDFHCFFTIKNDNYSLYFESNAKSKKEARNNVIKQFSEALFLDGHAYDFFPEDIKNDCPDKWLNCTEENSINVLQELEQAKLIKNVKYEFEQQGNDENGNPLWLCIGSFQQVSETPFEEYISSSKRGESLNKKEAKKKVAFALVQSYLTHKNFIKK